MLVFVIRTFSLTLKLPFRGKAYLLFQIVRGNLTFDQIKKSIDQINLICGVDPSDTYVEKMRKFEKIFFGHNIAKPRYQMPFLTDDPSMDMDFSQEVPP